MAAALLLAGSSASAQTNVLFILDASGSMKQVVGSEAKIVAAKRVMKATLADMPAEARLGLMLYGHRRAKDCTDIELVSPIGADDAATIAKTIEQVNPRGETPIAKSLEQAARSFAAFKGQRNYIVLVTDGNEECNGNPCATVDALKQASLDVRVDVVGFNLGAKERQAVQCIVEKTGGRYYDAKDAGGLTAAMGEVKREVAQASPTPPPAPKPPEEFNLLQASNGGQLIAAPNDNWARVITGNDADMLGFGCNDMPMEGIYAFKNEAPATFSKFEMLIPYTGKFVKDFEILAADDAPGGTYRSLGKFTTQNLKMLKTPYQEFTFPETTAKYFKIRVLSAYPSDCSQLMTQIRLIGKQVAQAAAAPAPAAAKAETNLLLASNGGQVIAAPNENWPKVITGNDADMLGFGCNDMPMEGIFAFKNEAPATFSKFEMLIPYTGKFVKDFEILAADDAPGGTYRSLGKFTTQNMKMIKTPYQEFSFPETTAKYFKLRVLSAYPSDCSQLLPQIRLMGTQSAQAAAAVPAAKPAQANLLLASAGGQVLAAPNETWQKVISGNDADAAGFGCNDMPLESVFAFKDEKPATISAFAILIPYTGKFVKDFEIMAANDGPGGPYRSLGKFTTQNMRMIKSPYQEFAFPETTAKYFKLRVLAAYPSDCSQLMTQIRVMGKPGG